MRVLRPDGPLPGDTEPTGHWSHVAATVDERVIGACTVGPSAWRHPDLVELVDPQWQLRSMAVLPEFRGGVGTQLLTAAVGMARAAGAASLWANARREALGLYTRGGWTIVGSQWHKPGIGPHRYVVLQRP